MGWREDVRVVLDAEAERLVTEAAADYYRHAVPVSEGVLHYPAAIDADARESNSPEGVAVRQVSG